MAFYDNVKKLCEKKKISLAAFAREMGLSNSATTYWKHGSVPKYETIKKIADYFGVEVEDLMDLDKEFIDEFISYCSEKKDERDEKELRKVAIDMAIENSQTDFYVSVESNADEAVIKNYAALTDSQLKSMYIDTFKYLNRLGRIEAVRRMEELTNISKYRK